jgi:hypothetical protein
MQALQPFESNVLEAGESRLRERNKLMSIQEVSAERFAQLFHCYIRPSSMILAVPQTFA